MKVAKSKASNDVVENEAVSAASDADGEGGMPLEDEDDFLVSDSEETEAAAKNAQMALSRVLDVDIDGGWNEGAP